MTLREHFSELRRRFKVAFLSFVIILVALLIIPSDPSAFLSQGYLGFTPLIAFFISRVKLDLLPPNWHFIVVSINEPLEIYIIASVLFAVIFNSPIFAYELIKFISPGLNEREKRLIYPFVFSTAGLFAFGAIFGYLFLAKFLLAALTPFFTFTGVVPPEIDAANFYFIVFLTIGMTGIAFTVPVYIYTLIRFGVIQAASFRKNRIIVWAITYIICAVITPDGGPLLDVLLFVPIITLLEVAVFIGGRSRASVLKREKAKASAAPPAPAPPAPRPPAPPTTAPSFPSSPPGFGASPPSAPASVSLPPAYTATSPTVPCPFCSFQVARGIPFCPNCGRSLE